MKTALAFATLLLTATLGAGTTHVYPLAPTTVTPVELHYLSGCRSNHTVVREGDQITITATDPQCNGTGTIVEKVKLGVLPMGLYNVNVVQWQDPFNLTGTRFVVRNGDAKPFELHPSATYYGDPIRLSGLSCGKPDCSDLTLRIDGQAVSITPAEGGGIWFVAPERGPGLVDVTVQKGDELVTSPGALYYAYSYRESSVVEPILFPVIHSESGGFGSRWESEAVVANPSLWMVDADYTLHNIGPCIADCDPPFEPRSFQRFQHGYPRGTVMYVPRSEASQLALSLRIRDVSRQAEGFGTEVPVVRERDFVHGRNIQLLDVPLDPRYRVKVRIYMVEPVLARSLAGTLRIHRNGTSADLPFTLLDHSNGLSYEPYYAEVDLPRVEASERVDLEVKMPVDAIGWAFASVTNNETQQVTIVAPY